MSPRGWRRAFHFPWRSPRRDVDEELAFHFEARIADLRATGFSPDEARRRAEEEFGNTEDVRQELIGIDTRIAQRDRRVRSWEQWSLDVRGAWRGIRRAPGFALLTVLTIALGVGATTAVFTVTDALLLRPIPYRDASRVFVVRRASPNPAGWPYGPMPRALVGEWQENSRLVESSVIFQAGGALAMIDGDDTTLVRRAIVDHGFFAFTGTPLLLGRAFTKDEMFANGPGAVLLSEELWRRQYGASRDAIGKLVTVGGQRRTIIGVVPARFALPDFRSERPEVWLPLPDDQDLVLQVVVRLKPGASREAASAEAAARLKGSALDKPWNRDIAWRIGLVRPEENLPFRGALRMLTGAVALLLLIAFINVAHLLLARGATRERELAVRHALGANRTRLLRHLAMESVLLGLAGGALAAGFAWAGMRLVSAVRPATLAALTYPSSGSHTITLAATLAIVAGLVVGVLSGLRVAHRNLAGSLRSSATRGGGRSSRFRATMVIGEVGLSAMLLVGALLLIHSVFDLTRTRLGFDERDLHTVRFSGREGESPEARMAFAMQLEEEARRLPGATAVSISGRTGAFLLSVYETPEQPPRGEVAGTEVSSVGPDYFRMMGMELLSGRTFDDGSAARNEVIISSSLARSIWGSESPLGHQFRDTRTKAMRGELEPWKTVIGVAADVVDNVLDRDGAPAIYSSLDLRGRGDAGVTLVIRMRGPGAMERLKELAKSIRPDVPDSFATQFESVEETIRLSMAEPRFTMAVLVAFAGVAVLLAAVGLFGVISYSVKERTREIGVRMALGATRSGVARLVVGEGLRLAIFGLALGLVGAVFASRLLEKMLYGVPQLDPFAFGAGGVLLLAVSVLACTLPMLRATGIDPIAATRAD